MKTLKPCVDFLSLSVLYYKMKRIINDDFFMNLVCKIDLFGCKTKIKCMLTTSTYLSNYHDTRNIGR